MSDIAGIIIALSGFVAAIGAIYVSAATNKSSARKEDLEQMRMAQDALESTVTHLQVENQRLIGRIQAYEAEAEKLMSRLETLESAKCEAELVIKGLQAHIQELETDRQAETANRQRLTVQVTELTEQVRILEEQLQSLGVIPVTKQKGKGK